MAIYAYRKCSAPAHILARHKLKKKTHSIRVSKIIKLSQVAYEPPPYFKGAS